MGKTYSKTKCHYCGRIISSSGWANRNHWLMHVRRGDVKNPGSDALDEIRRKGWSLPGVNK